MSSLQRLNSLSGAALLILVISVAHFFSTELDPPERDQARYLDYTHSLIAHGTFGLGCGNYDVAPSPGNANAPLYPLLLSTATVFDSGLEAKLYCSLQAQGRRSDCLIGTGIEADRTLELPDACGGEDFSSISLLHHALFALSLFGIYLVAREIFDRSSLHWLTLLAALASGIFSKYVDRVLTENLLLTLFIYLQYVLAIYFKSKGYGSIALVGVLFGLLTLTRPEYPYLAILGFVVLLGLGLVRQGKYAIHGVILIVAFSISISPWLIRNQSQFDSWAISAGNYGEIILAHRIAYNDMDAKHWLSAFVYFLPDFGDSVTERVFPESWYWRERDELAGSYQNLADQLVTLSVQESRDVSQMLREDVIGDLPKHVITTIPLSWRGVFIAKYWGLFAFFAYLFFQYREIRAGRWTLAFIALPVWILVGLHGAISINIPRYNLPLISIYALSLAWFFDEIWQRVQRRKDRTT